MPDVDRIGLPGIRTKTARSPREKRKHRRYDRTKSAARELFLRDGYEPTTLRAIAKKARVAAATIVLYFW